MLDKTEGVRTIPEKSVSWGRTPMKFRGTTNKFKFPPNQLFHILGKPPHQQILNKKIICFFPCYRSIKSYSFSFLLQYSCKDNACIQMGPPIYILILMLFTDFGF